MGLATSAEAPGPPGVRDPRTGPSRPPRSLSRGGQSGGEQPLPWVAQRPRSPAREGAPCPVLNKEPFAGPEAPARGGRRVQKASALFSPYLLFTRSPAGPGRGVETPAALPAWPASRAATAPGGSSARRELLPAAPTWWGSQSPPGSGASPPPRTLFPALRLAGKAPGSAGPWLPAPVRGVLRPEGLRGRGPYADPCGRRKARRAPGGGGLPPALGGPRRSGPPHPETKMAVRGALRRPALATGHLSHRAWGAARCSITARPRPLRGVSDRETPAGLVG